MVFGSLSNHKRWLITLSFNTIYYIYENLIVAIVFNMEANDIYMYIYDTPFSLDNGTCIDAKDFRYKVKALWTYVDRILFTKFFDLQRLFIVVAKMKKWMHNNLKIFALFLF